MKKFLAFFGILFLVLTGFPAENVAAASLSDGTYSISYTVLENSSSSASIADGYFKKPATVRLNNGTYTVEMTMTNSSWITSFTAGSDNQVIATDPAADSRTIQFKVNSLDQPINADMKVDIDSMDYHHTYTVQLVMDIANASLIAAATPTGTEASSSNNPSGDTGSTNTTSTTTTGSTSTAITNPKTSDSTHAQLYFAMMLVAAIGIGILFYHHYRSRKDV